jgi:uncharacterized membrane protein
LDIELVIAGFDDDHTAFLARSALARLRTEINVDGHDLAVVTRESDGAVILREDVDLDAEQDGRPSFWSTLVGLLLSEGEEQGDRAESTPSARLHAVGIDEIFVAQIRHTIKPGDSAVFVLARAATRDRVIAVMRGFRGRVQSISLLGELG